MKVPCWSLCKCYIMTWASNICSRPQRILRKCSNGSFHVLVEVWLLYQYASMWAGNHWGRREEESIHYLAGDNCKIGMSFCIFSFGLGFASAFLTQFFCVQKEPAAVSVFIKISGLDENQFSCLEIRVLLPLGKPVIWLQASTWWRHAGEW